MTLHAALRQGEDFLQKSGVEDPRWNAERLLLYALRIKRAEAYSSLNRELTAAEMHAFQSLLERRAAHEPLAYIEGTQEFYGREFQVNEHVLIPRPETEEIIRAALELQLPARPRIVDLGSGSGCIGITLALEIPGARVTALEISAEAIDVLKCNARGAIQIVRGDFLALPFQRETFDLIVSNPPYVESGDLANLPLETKHEPRIALIPDSIRGIYGGLLATAALCLKPGGYLIFEIGAGQEQLIETLVRSQSDLSLTAIRNDFRNIPRTFVTRKNMFSQSSLSSQ